MNYTQFEKAAFNSWPALEQTESGGIVLRFSNGYTKRANSANLLETQTGDFDPLLQQYENFFETKNLPCIFRIPSFTQNQKFDRFLEDKGYRHCDQTLVLQQSLENCNLNAVDFPDLTSSKWLKIYCRMREFNFEDHLTHLAMLNRIQDKTLFAVLAVDGVEVACGLGVLSNGLFGLFDICTKNTARNKGYGSQLVEGMLHWAIKNGASSAYLQVVANNEPAKKLYAKMGYQHAYEYWYRVRDAKQ